MLSIWWFKSISKAILDFILPRNPNHNMYILPHWAWNKLWWVCWVCLLEDVSVPACHLTRRDIFSGNTTLISFLEGLASIHEDLRLRHVNTSNTLKKVLLTSLKLWVMLNVSTGSFISVFRCLIKELYYRRMCLTGLKKNSQPQQFRTFCSELLWL